jgi:hypothetical protein
MYSLPMVVVTERTKISNFCFQKLLWSEFSHYAVTQQNSEAKEEVSFFFGAARPRILSMLYGVGLGRRPAKVFPSGVPQWPAGANQHTCKVLSTHTPATFNNLQLNWF